jgi:hypothetical protein
MNLLTGVGSMLNRLAPAVGQWYRNEQGAVFEVVAFEKEAGVIEIQHFDGAVEELDIDSWYSQMPKASAAPEDWSGPFDDLLADDFGDTESARHPDEWNNPLDTLDWEE